LLHDLSVLILILTIPLRLSSASGDHVSISFLHGQHAKKHLEIFVACVGKKNYICIQYHCHLHRGKDMQETTAIQSEYKVHFFSATVFSIPPSMYTMNAKSWKKS
jgi:hypothetical protein